jgi:hypothetical protein
VPSGHALRAALGEGVRAGQSSPAGTVLPSGHSTGGRVVVGAGRYVGEPPVGGFTVCDVVIGGVVVGGGREVTLVVVVVVVVVGPGLLSSLCNV